MGFEVPIPDPKPPFTLEEWGVRVHLALAYRAIAHYGWNDFIFNHVSMAIPDNPGAFCLNPYGLLFGEVCASNLLTVHFKKGVTYRSSDEFEVNEAAIHIHESIHEARPDAKCVLHLHTPDTVAVSCLERGLLPLNQTALIIYSDVSYHDFEGIVLRKEERSRIAKNLGEKNILILRNHGVITLGTTVAEAFTRMIFLQRACEIQNRLSSKTDALILPENEIIERVKSQAESQFKHVANNLIWPAVYRSIMQIDDSFLE